MTASNPTRQTRNNVLERDGYRCVRCGTSILGIQYSIHHRRMRSHPFDGLHDSPNLITLCGTGTIGCHGYVHNHPKESYEAGWLVKSTRNPADVSVTYHDGHEYNLKGDTRERADLPHDTYTI